MDNSLLSQDKSSVSMAGSKMATKTELKASVSASSLNKGASSPAQRASNSSSLAKQSSSSSQIDSATSKSIELSSNTNKSIVNAKASSKSSPITTCSQQSLPKDAELTSDVKKNAQTDKRKQKTSEIQEKSTKGSDSTGDIAEAMIAGNLNLGGVPSKMLDSDKKQVAKKTLPSKPAQSSPSLSKKRPADNKDGDAVTKKVKYEEENSGGIRPNDKATISKQEDIAKLPPHGQGKALPQGNAKRIVRRFHRTTQTIPRPSSTAASQCTFDSPPKSKKPRSASCAIQFQGGDTLIDLKRLMDLNIFPDGNIVKPEIFKAALFFGVSSLGPDTMDSGVYKYAIRVGLSNQSDVNRSILKDNLINKGDKYSISFWGEDNGTFDIMFHGEDKFNRVLNHIRKIRIGPRYLCVTVLVQNIFEEKKNKDSPTSHDYLKATVVFDQNFDSIGFTSYHKVPVWSKPKVEEFVTLHNVPEGIPVSFLKLIFPDAITLQTSDGKHDDNNHRVTKKNSYGVRLGFNKKHNPVMKLFSQVLINDTPIFLTDGITDRKDVAQLRENSKVKSGLDTLEIERKMQNSAIRCLNTTARNINACKKNVSSGGKATTLPAKNSGPSTPSSKKGKDRGTSFGQHEQEDACSDLSDISDGPFDASNNASSRPVSTKKDGRSYNKLPSKKIEPKKSSTLTMGSKLLNKARTRGNIHQPQNRRQDQEQMSRTRRGTDSSREPVKLRDESSRKLPERPRIMRAGDRNFTNRLRNSPQSDRPRPIHGRDEHLNDRSPQGSQFRQGQWNSQRDQNDSGRLRNERRSSLDHLIRTSPGRPRRTSPDHMRRFSPGHRRTPPDHPRRTRSRDRSSDREFLNRNSDRPHRSRERHERDLAEVRSRPGERVHLGPRRNSLDRRSGRSDEFESDDLRSVLDSLKPKQGRMSPRRFGSSERLRDSHPGRQKNLPESRKRPLLRSPSPSNRRVVLNRRSLSPRNPQQRGGSYDYSQAKFPSPPSRTGREAMAGEFFKGESQDFRESQHVPSQHVPTQHVPQSFHGGEQKPQVGGEESMTISKSLFVKLLANALHDDEEGNPSQRPATGDRSHPPLPSNNNQAARILPQARDQENVRGNPGRDGSFMQHHHQERMLPNFENERRGGNNFRSPVLNKESLQQANSPRHDPKPIPPPIMPPLLASTSTPVTYPIVNKNISNMNDQGKSHSEGPPLSQTSSHQSRGVWAAPPPQSSFNNALSGGRSFNNALPERPPQPSLSQSNSSPQMHPPFSSQSPMFNQSILSAPPPFMPMQQPGPNSLQSGPPPPRPALWQNPRPGYF